jgi:meiotically up-regulated gene 157 (Mug157) protein
MVWPKAKAIEALTKENSKEELARPFGFQLRKSQASACDIAMLESVHVDDCDFSRPWFEWANPFLWCWLRALFEFGTIRLVFSTCGSEIQLATAG